MTEEVAVYKTESTALTISEAISISQMMAQSGYFDDARQAAQAFVKIMAGREMGVGPFAAMTGISIIKGKLVITANLLAAAIRAHPRYDYQIITLDDQACELAFYENDIEIGRSKFTKEDAAAAEIGRMVAPGASTSMMKRFPRNMLFARAVSNGFKWYTPDAASGAAVYTPDELGAEEQDDGTVIEVEAVPVTEISEIIEPPEQPHPKDLQPKSPTQNQWWPTLVKELAEHGYAGHNHIINALKAETWDPEAMTPSHAADIKAVLVKRHEEAKASAAITANVEEAAVPQEA